MITFRPLERPDFPLLGRWLAEPHVHRWWFHDHTPAAVERDFGPSVDGEDPTDVYVVIHDGDPIGIIQCSAFDDYPEYVEEMRPLIEVPPGAYSVDYLIGEPDLVGRGLGTTMIASFIEGLWSEKPGATCVIVPVSSANEASWRALLGAGFEIVTRGDLIPDNPADDPPHEILRLDRPD